MPFAAVAVTAAIVGAKARTPEGEIAPGVRVGDMALGGKVVEDARKALEPWSRQVEERVVLLGFEPDSGIVKVWKPTARKLGLGVDVQATLAEAGTAGRDGIISQVAGVFTGPKTVQVAPHPSVDKAKLRAYLKQIAYAVNRRPVNAKFQVTGGGFSVGKEKPGLSMDVDASLNAVTQVWNNVLVKTASPAAATESKSPTSPIGGSAPPPPPSDSTGASGQTPTSSEPASETAEVTLSAKITQAAVTAEDLKSIDGQLGAWSTYYGGTGSNRSSNIALAAGHINGTLLKPGGVFSYNDVVGPRTKSAGFKDAPGYVANKADPVPTVGGGVCQVSSTLYNAIWRSGLKIVHRQCHMYPVHYLPLGCDATVVDGAIDFRFENDTEAPVYIAASAHRGRLSFAVYGKKDPDRSVSIEKISQSITPAPVIRRIDANLPAGRMRVEQKGHKNIRVSWVRIIKKSGQVVKREMVYSHYRPAPQIVAVGARPKAAPRPQIGVPAPGITPPPPASNPIRPGA